MSTAGQIARNFRAVPVHDLFGDLACRTWRIISYANSKRIVFGEDTITSINLLEIASLSNASAIEDTRIDEEHKGCDFELWIGSDLVGWSRYAVQAKRIGRGQRYDKLGHKVGGSSQIDILRRYANQVGAEPLYCFYNFAQVRVWHCKLPRDDPQLGCMITPAAVVHNALNGRRGTRSFRWMHEREETIPWRCLITCPCGSARWCRTTREAHHYRRLPEELHNLWQTPAGSLLTQASVADQADRLLAPRWTVVVDTGAGKAVKL